MKVLHIEDNEGDLLLTKVAFSKIDTPTEVFSAANGKEGIEFLQKEDKQKIDLILLDINMPLMDGRKFLAEKMQLEGLDKIPVIVLTTSESTNDVNYCYAHGANAYVKKGMDFTDYLNSIKAIETFWMKTNLYPTMMA